MLKDISINPAPAIRINTSINQPKGTIPKTMTNITAKIEKQGSVEMLTVSLPIQKRPSASGKTTVVASTNGNQPTAVMIDGKPVIIGFNAYIK